MYATALALTHTCTHACTHPHSHIDPYTHSHRHTDTQTHRHTDTQTHRHTRNQISARPLSGDLGVLWRSVWTTVATGGALVAGHAARHPVCREPGNRVSELVSLFVNNKGFTSSGAETNVNAYRTYSAQKSRNHKIPPPPHPTPQPPAPQKNPQN